MIVKGYRRIAVVVFVVVTAFLVRERAHGQQKVSNDFLVTRVRVFDRGKTLQNTQVAVNWRHCPRRRRGPGVVASPSCYRRLGSTLVPGLIGCALTSLILRNLRQALRFGVTTVLEMGASTKPERVLFGVPRI